MDRGRNRHCTDLAACARDKGVRLAIEACGGQLVYNVSSMLRLLDAVGGDVVGANLDPSHPMWMGADIPTVISRHPHRHQQSRIGDLPRSRQGHPDPTTPGNRDGLLDTLPIDRANERAWNYLTLGLGHPAGATFWADFVYALRGVDGTLNIEHEDTLLNSMEGVRRAATLLKQVVLEAPADWRPANI